MAVLLLALGLLGVVALVTRSFRSELTSPSADSRNVSRSKRISIEAHQSHGPSMVKGSPPPMPSAAASGETQDSLKPSSAGQDPLSASLSDMESTNPETRKAALEAIIQLDDRSAIPRLRDIAARTKDPKEKSDILAAIEFMELPSIQEYLAAKRANAAATGQANPPKTSTHGASGGITPHGQSSQPPQANQ